MATSRKFVKRRVTRRLVFVGGLFSIIFYGSLSCPTATTQHPPRALTLSTHIQCPAYPVSGKFPISLNADVYGTEDSEILKDIVFRWNVSEASIVSGQGTRNIVLDPSMKSGLSEIKIDLEVEGGPPELVYQASCVLKVDSQCSLAPRIDQYGGISLDEEHNHLDRLAQRLKAGPSDLIAYIVSYAGQEACLYEPNWRAKRARQYLIERHGIPSSRLVTVAAGFKEKWAVELYIQARSECGPLPKPTLMATQVRVRGHCDETR